MDFPFFSLFTFSTIKIRWQIQKTAALEPDKHGFWLCHVPQRDLGNVCGFLGLPLLACESGITLQSLPLAGSWAWHWVRRLSPRGGCSLTSRSLSPDFPPIVNRYIPGGCIWGGISFIKSMCKHCIFLCFSSYPLPIPPGGLKLW